MTSRAYALLGPIIFVVHLFGDRGFIFSEENLRFKIGWTYIGGKFLSAIFHCATYDIRA